MQRWSSGSNASKLSSTSTSSLFMFMFQSPDRSMEVFKERGITDRRMDQMESTNLEAGLCEESTGDVNKKQREIDQDKQVMDAINTEEVAGVH